MPLVQPAQSAPVRVARRPFQFTLRVLFGIVTFIALILGSWQGFVMWNKANFCQGWADEYMRRADESRQMASDPAMTEVDAEGYRLHAKRMEIIAGKYQDVADRPWRRYPRHPLITADEEANAAKRH